MSDTNLNETDNNRGSIEPITRKFGHKIRDNGERRRLHNEELHSLYMVVDTI